MVQIRLEAPEPLQNSFFDPLLLTLRDELKRRLRAIPGVVRAELDASYSHEGGWVLHVGIDETGSAGLELRAAPRGNAELPREIMDSSREFDIAFEETMQTGQAGDDVSQGHSLMSNPAARGPCLGLDRQERERVIEEIVKSQQNRR